MVIKFNKKIARQIANREFVSVLDSILNNNIDSPFSLISKGEDFIDIFEDELIQRGINPTDKRLDIMMSYYDEKRDKFVNDVRKKYYN